MPYLYLILAVFMSSSSSIFGKIFNRQNSGKKDANVLYNFILMISVFLGWGVTCLIKFSFDAGVLIYSALFGICFVAGFLGMINALKYGPAILTALLVSLSSILVTIWGFIFWNSKINATVIIGLIFAIACIFLCLYNKNGKENKEDKISLKWLFYVILAFLGNAGCLIVQRTEQINYNGQHGNMLMLFATGFATIIYLFIFLKSKKTDFLSIIKTSCHVPILAGVCNVLSNALNILMVSTTLSPNLIYPVIGTGGLSVVTIFSLFVFKEKMRWWQWIGILFGILAVTLLSL